MSKYLESPDYMLTSSWLGSIAQSYILNELRSSIRKNIFSMKLFVEDNGKALIQKILDKSNYKLRMYGSADELVQNLKIYQNFQKSYRFFKTEFEPFTTTATIYRSLKDEEYICKSDLFVILQNMALDIIPAADSAEVFPMIIVFLLSEQDELPHRMEFIKFDQKVFDEIEMEMRETKKLCAISLSELVVLGTQFAAGNFDSLVAKFEKVNVVKRDPDEIREELKDYYNKIKASNPNPVKDLVLLLITTAAMICLNQIINVKRPEMFHPNSINKTPMIVRLFEEGDQKFVMESEMVIAMFPEEASEIFGKKGEVEFHNYSTITLDEALRQGAGRVEFIRYPIKRAKHRAVPIEGPDPEDPNDWCILALDAFFEYMKSAITGFKIFQKCGTSADAFGNAEHMFSALEKVFKHEVKSPYFLQIESINYMLTTLQNDMKSFPTTKDVRNVKKNGFTVQHLKNELNHLGLTGTFPEILDCAEDVYEGIDKAKKERYLRTCDLFDAVESCQLICLLNRVPNLKMFVHNQKGCGRILGYKCEHCEEKKNASDETVPTPSEKEIQKPLKNLKIESSDETSSQKEEEEVQKTSVLQNPPQNPKNEGSNNSENNKENQNPIKDQKTSKKMVSDIMNLLAQRSKVPIEILKENSEECISESQQQTQLQMELKEKISAKTEENQRLQETILKLTAENEANQRVIQQLLDKLAVGKQKKDMEEVSDDSGDLLAVRIPPVVICYVCHKEIEPSDDDWLDCSRTGEKFHQVCAYFHIRFHEECPACDDKIPNYF
ncbi:hypothetical protein GCK72_003935 [Caenorhabditis remanei]|uniref:DUF7809 domain-containing protein n=1 Tax=Caenorhabditis remanei TaxID=31234 RepID=A0A6A5HAA6_CAERE|nr:hypothetical protein GCK72_003935 [Caenorhabditis remanei]KAF1763989.1 hypothetical protein GCK72_003935 [Caenorhabditis remanei]